jgi:hypothetical protein
MDGAIQITYADLIGWALVVACSLVCVLIILSHQSECTATTRACMGIAQPLGSAFLSTLITFVVCFLTTIYNTVHTLLSGLWLLPISWYAMTTLTILPVCIQISQHIVIVYLACYCATGLYICATTTPQKKATPIAANVQTLKAHFLSELRITSVQ